MLEVKDFNDEVLPITENHIEEAEQYIRAIAARFGVSKDKIAEPLSYMVKRLGVAYAYICVCREYMGRDPVAHEGYADTDIYYAKLQVYQGEVDRLLKQITDADFLISANGTTVDGGTGSTSSYKKLFSVEVKRA